MKIGVVGSGKSFSKSVLTMALPICLAVAGCHGATQVGPLDTDQSFVKIDRPLDAQAASIRTQAVPGTGTADQSFFLALNKKELGKRWFMSAYLKQFFPGAVMGGAAASLGTRVVTFRVQNGKLFVFDASDNYKDSDTFDPKLILESYPIVNTYGPYNDLSNADKYVLFDPAAGLNRFGVVADMFAYDPAKASNFQVDAAYMSNFRALTDGVTFEQVFTGASTVFPINDGFQTGNVFRASGTLGLALRRYQEGDGFKAMPYDGSSYFFYGDIAQVPDTGSLTSSYVHWNIHKGMKPIKWLISDQFVKANQDPRYQQYDIVGAIKKGVTNWNEVFGFKALEVEVATANDSYADDDTNYIIFDGDPTFGAAFANWRQNPNTNEIRGASVYFNAAWLDIADYEFGVAPTPSPDGRPAQPVAALAKPKTPTLTWGNWKNEPLCVMWTPKYRADRNKAEALTPDPNAALTPKQKVENFLTHVVIHEVGHTLGLRHNFKGSNGQPGGSTSVMEYVDDADAVASGRDHAGPYDIAAIKLLYGMSTDLPAQPFCTDQDTVTDVDCNPFDRGADPLTAYYAKNYSLYMNFFLTYGFFFPPDYYVNGTLQFVRSSQTSTRMADAFKLAMKGLTIPADANLVATNMGYGSRVDMATQFVLNRLYLDLPANRGSFTSDPPLDSTLTPLVMTELRGNLTNADQIRSYETRRMVVDILKKMQTQDAYNLLLAAKDALTQQLTTLTGNEKANTMDLIARIDAATHPYYK
ncbi:MAG: hypothetical protein JWN44_2303 [Myxococcales bacterium]|nr:hypothetical protein [Myxococcales bacterium]